MHCTGIASLAVLGLLYELITNYRTLPCLAVAWGSCMVRAGSHCLVALIIGSQYLERGSARFRHGR